MLCANVSKCPFSLTLWILSGTLFCFDVKMFDVLFVQSGRCQPISADSRTSAPSMLTQLPRSSWIGMATVKQKSSVAEER